MTVKLYYESAYIREFDAEVISCTENKGKYLVELDRTAFYPEGGGQPADTGVLGDVRVTDVHEKEGHIYHCCDAAVEPGTKLHGCVDWDRRFDHMQQHSGEHIVSGMICESFDCDNVGFHMGRDVISIDYNADITMDSLGDIEERANRYIWENHELSVHFYEGDELNSIAYRSKKELTGEVRIVSFPGADTCACCGTHVSHSAEVGLVKFISCQKISKGTRIELLCGRRAFDFLSMNFAQNASIARSMSAGIDKTELIYKKQLAEFSETKLRLSEAEKKYCALRAELCRDKGNVLIIDEELSAEAVKLLCQAASAVCGGMCAVFGGSGDLKYAAGGADVRGLVKDINAGLSGKGGGGAGFAQGFVKSDSRSVRLFFKENMSEWVEIQGV